MQLYEAYSGNATVTYQFSQDSMVFQILYKVPLLSVHVIFNILKKVKNDNILSTM